MARAAAAASRTEALPRAELERILRDVLDGRPPSTDDRIDPELRRRILERLIEEALAEAGVPTTPEEVRQIAALLESGEFFRDLGSATAAVVSALPGMPLAIAGDLGRTPEHLTRVAAALAADLGETPDEVAAVLADLRDGRVEASPPLLTRTLRELYELAALEAIVRTLRAWLDPDNETVRLAILLYARAHGLPLDPKDLDAVRRALDPVEPDLGPVLIAAWDHLESRLGPPGLAAALASLGGTWSDTSPPTPASERQRE
jgi:hypothetical protein